MQRFWKKYPAICGALAGFFLLPLLWWLQNALLQMLLGFSLGIRYFPRFPSLWVALPSVIMGAAISQAVAVKRRGDERKAKWCLLFPGLLIVGWYGVISALTLWQNWPRPAPGTSLGAVTWNGIGFSWWSFPIFVYFVWPSLFNFPLQVALLMFFFGLLMRTRR